MFKEKIDAITDYLREAPSHLYGLLLAVLLNELRKLFWRLTLKAIGLKPIGVISMEKAYDVKALLEKFKKRGLDLTEDAAKMIIEDTCSWIQESAAISENKIDDVAALALPN